MKLVNLSIPYVKDLQLKKSNLVFGVTADTDYGNKFFLENNQNFNSVSRPNWFGIEKYISL
jgi:lipopolysaccharide transport system ATP-binding protein